ncbi:MAG: hypothetical protein SFT94_12580 [Pseudanabaenaceae cyanobacterium bins.68]|nr:hypothetical protein [Pseudanabaenaceae cyanobacterium bins.68]
MTESAFSPLPPAWTRAAIHAHLLACPQCQRAAAEAVGVWLNRSAPVYDLNHRRQWQEFYQCSCGCAWWAWSSDRPPSQLTQT